MAVLPHTLAFLILSSGWVLKSLGLSRKIRKVVPWITSLSMIDLIWAEQRGTGGQFGMVLSVDSSFIRLQYMRITRANQRFSSTTSSSTFDSYSRAEMSHDSHLTPSSSLQSIKIIGQSATSGESQLQRYASFSYYAYRFVSEHAPRTTVCILQRRYTSSITIPFLTYFISID